MPRRRRGNLRARSRRCRVSRAASAYLHQVGSCACESGCRAEKRPRRQGVREVRDRDGRHAGRDQGAAFARQVAFGRGDPCPEAFAQMVACHAGRPAGACDFYHAGQFPDRGLMSLFRYFGRSGRAVCRPKRRRSCRRGRPMLYETVVRDESSAGKWLRNFSEFPRNST